MTHFTVTFVKRRKKCWPSWGSNSRNLNLNMYNTLTHKYTHITQVHSTSMVHLIPAVITFFYYCFYVVFNIMSATSKQNTKSWSLAKKVNTRLGNGPSTVDPVGGYRIQDARFQIPRVNHIASADSFNRQNAFAYRHRQFYTIRFLVDYVLLLEHKSPGLKYISVEYPCQSDATNKLNFVRFKYLLKELSHNSGVNFPTITYILIYFSRTNLRKIMPIVLVK